VLCVRVRVHLCYVCARHDDCAGLCRHLTLSTRTGTVQDWYSVSELVQCAYTLHTTSYILHIVYIEYKLVICFVPK